MCRLVVWFSIAAVAFGQSQPGTMLPDGREYVTWERQLRFSRTYYVDNGNPQASDANPGSKDSPFRTIGKAAQVLQPGERVVIETGVYRERVSPARGGAGPDQMISYEAAPGAVVVVRGSREVKSGWQPSTGFRLGRQTNAVPRTQKIYQLSLEGFDFGGYNPFGMVNVLDDRTSSTFIGAPPMGLRPYLAKRGMVFVDGRRLEQAELYRELAEKENAFWVEPTGLMLHLRLAQDADPAGHQVELVTQEQVFAPRERHLGYIRVKGITFEYGANGFPVPQRGIVSANRGHHWIIENCTVRHANAVAIDIGNETWNADDPPMVGYSIVRRNTISDAGVCGLAGMGVTETLVEDNLIERVGWQNVEPMWESGGIKLHRTKSCVVRHNVIRHLTHAPGLWLDYTNVNTRVVANVFADIRETVRAGIYLEASHEPNMLDHNIFWNITAGTLGTTTAAMHPEGGWGILEDGSDEAVIAHNLFGFCESFAVKIRTTENRIVAGRGGVGFWNRVLNNIFYKCGRSIDFATKDNMAEGNLYVGGQARGANGEGLGLNWIEGPGAILRLDLFAWQRYFGFDRTGANVPLEIDVDPEALQMRWQAAGEIPEVETAKHFRQDFLGETAGTKRAAGPLLRIPREKTTVAINPRAR